MLLLNPCQPSHRRKLRSASVRLLMTLPATPLKWRKIIRTDFSSAQKCLQTISPSKATDLNKKAGAARIYTIRGDFNCCRDKKHLPNSGITHKTSGMYIIFSSYQRVLYILHAQTSGIVLTCQPCVPDCIFHQTIVLATQNIIFLRWWRRNAIW